MEPYVLTPDQQVMYDAFSGSESERYDKIRFIQGFQERGLPIDGLAAAAIPRSILEQWRNSDPSFERYYRDCTENKADELEKELWNRIMHGVRKPVTFQGQITTWYRDKECTNDLLMKALTAKRPHVFNERMYDTGTMNTLIMEMKKELHRLGVGRQDGSIVDAEFKPVSVASVMLPAAPEESPSEDQCKTQKTE